MMCLDGEKCFAQAFSFGGGKWSTGCHGLPAAKLFQCRLGKKSTSSSACVCQSRCRVTGRDAGAPAGEPRAGAGCWVLPGAALCGAGCSLLAAGAAPWVPAALRGGSHPAGRPPRGQEPVVLVGGDESFIPAAGVEFLGIAGLNFAALQWSEEHRGC